MWFIRFKQWLWKVWRSMFRISTEGKVSFTNTAKMTRFTTSRPNLLRHLRLNTHSTGLWVFPAKKMIRCFGGNLGLFSFGTFFKPLSFEDNDPAELQAVPERSAPTLTYSRSDPIKKINEGFFFGPTSSKRFIFLDGVTSRSPGVISTALNLNTRKELEHF